MNQVNRQPLPLLFLALLLAGCSAQKNTGLSRAYHNLTAKYNVLFNANESFKKGLVKIASAHKDDYSTLLPIFYYSDKDAVLPASADMDRSIKKCSKLISLHSITAKPKVRDSKNLTPEQREFFNKKEYNMFVDDAYMLMGKSHFYKHEFSMASDIFKRVVNDFKKQPVVYEAQVWLARLSIETGQYLEASDLLALLINNAEFPKKLLPELYPTYADFYLKQKDYAQAIYYLEKAVEVEKHKRVTTRYYFLLAQLCEKTGDLKRASDCYKQVVQMTPSYEMAFNAHINRALTYERGFGQVADIEKELTGMLRDDKNIDYQDQIYYALGNLAAKEGNYPKALEYYTKSIEANKGNDQQKVRSYLTIADYYYNIPDYLNAQAYYDSAVSNITPDYPGYNALYSKSTSLTRLVNEINTVTLADSVLLLAKLPQKDLYDRIDAIIESERKKEEQARLKEQQKQLDQRFDQETALRNTNRQQASSSSSGVKWYFYNDAAKNLGYNEFKLKWGNRRLEDHWQRSSKALVNIMPRTMEENADSVETTASEPAYSKMSREFYLANIPFSDSAKESTLKKAESALYSMGTIYKDDLKDYDKASESFKELIRRYPSSSYMLSCYYNLYSIAREQNNMAMVDYYKNIIISRFPESMYARVLTNPEYFRELEKEEQKIQQYYNQTYALYQSGGYNQVITRVKHALNSYPDHLLIPHFTYLGILSEGKTIDRALFRDKLIAFVSDYPKTELADDARNIVRYMDAKHPEMKEAEEVKVSLQLYQFPGAGPHYFAFAVDKKINTNQLVFNIINFNLDHFDSLNLIVDIVSINTVQNLVTVRTFRRPEKAVEYMKIIADAEEIRKDIPETVLLPFTISETNLNTLKKDKSVDRYLKFYKENYP